MRKNRFVLLAVFVLGFLTVGLVIAAGVGSQIRSQQSFDRGMGEATFNSGAFMVLVGFWIVVGGVVGFLIGNPKGRPILGFTLGALFGFIGWIAMLFVEPTAEVAEQRTQAAAAVLRDALTSTPAGPTRPCPWCAEDIKPEAKVCRYCGRDVKPVEPIGESPPPSIVAASPAPGDLSLAESGARLTGRDSSATDRPRRLVLWAVLAAVVGVVALVAVGLAVLEGSDGGVTAGDRCTQRFDTTIGRGGVPLLCGGDIWRKPHLLALCKVEGRDYPTQDGVLTCQDGRWQYR